MVFVDLSLENLKKAFILGLTKPLKGQACAPNDVFFEVYLNLTATKTPSSQIILKILEILRFLVGSIE